MTNIITFRNFTQKCLWDNEISGQLSDGKWENSNVDRKFWNAESKVGTPGVNFDTYRRANFNFASSDLLDIVGDRMLLIAKASKITKDEKVVNASQYLEGIETETDFNNIKDYRKKYLKPFIKTWSEAEEILNVKYSKSNLIYDLKDMSTTISLAGNNPTITLGKISDKDIKRAEDILSKAKGDKEKEKQYTSKMAKLTLDKSKLQSRGDAMKKLGKPELANIFYDRLRESRKIKVSNLIKLVENKTGKKIILKEKITFSELNSIEKWADKLFSILNIDIVFTRHFYDRLNDVRNRDDIETEELIDIFKKFFIKYKSNINLIPLNKGAVLKDLNSQINIPFSLSYNPKDNNIDFISKTIMRTDNFLSKDRKIIV